ncbi:MAG: hypothetical protein MUP70_17780 [Candidatus Aminicenantes bacterium]|nr:hypothetical protein [Candidatus Aminicenantes bacterium]
MKNRNTNLQKLLPVPLAAAFLLALLFAFALGQDPLYTSNQNNYFLYGLAKAEKGRLAEDWTANTSDPVPLFSAVVAFVYHHLHPFFFHVIYGLITMAYFLALLMIAGALDRMRRGPPFWYLFSAILIVLHSRALLLLGEKFLGIHINRLLLDGVADQYVLGRYLQPSTAGVFLLLAVGLFMRRRLFAAAFSLGAAVLIHPTYLFPAALLTLALMGWTAFREKTPVRGLMFGAVVLLFAVPNLLYVILKLDALTADSSSAAHTVLSLIRMPQHADPMVWVDGYAIVCLALIAAAFLVVRKTSLAWIIGLSFSAALVLTVARVLTGSLSLSLLFPWRVTAVLAPLALTIVLFWLMDILVQNGPLVPMPSRSSRFLIFGLSALLALSGLIYSGRFLHSRYHDGRADLFSDVRENCGERDLYLIPVDMESFRLATGCPVFVDWKSIPFRSAEILVWYERLQRAEVIYFQLERQSGDLLQKTAHKYGLTHVVFKGDTSLEMLDVLVPVYKKNGYSIARIRLD